MCVCVCECAHNAHRGKKYGEAKKKETMEKKIGQFLTQNGVCPFSRFYISFSI